MDLQGGSKGIEDLKLFREVRSAENNNNVSVIRIRMAEAGYYLLMGFGQRVTDMPDGRLSRLKALVGPRVARLYFHGQLPSGSVAVLIREGVELGGVGMKMLNDCA